MKIPTLDPISTWYELNVIGEQDEILVVRIHNAAMSELVEMVKSNAPVVLQYQKKFDLPEFIEPAHDCWGFKKVLCKTPCIQDGWTEYRIILPIMEEGGLSALYPLRATLKILFDALFLFGGDTGWHLPQLMVVTGLLVDRSWHGGALGVAFTPAMIKFLSMQENEQNLPAVIDIMRKAYERISGDVRYPFGKFRAFCRQPKWIHFSVPGDACQLDPDSYDSSLERGYKLSSHNVDSGLQQLSLIMGLAKLHSLARKGQ